MLAAITKLDEEAQFYFERWYREYRKNHKNESQLNRKGETQ